MDYNELSETVKDVMKTSLGLPTDEIDSINNKSKGLNFISKDEAEFKEGIYPESVEVVADVIEDDREARTKIFDGPLDESDIAHIVAKDIENAKQYQAHFSHIFTENYKAYHALIDSRFNRPNRSTFVSSDVLDTVEWIMPSLMRIFTSTDDVVLIKPVEASDTENAEINQELLNYQFTCKMEGFTKLYVWIKDALIYGTGVIKINWETFYDKGSFKYDELTENEFNLLSQEPNISIEAYDEYTSTEITIDTETGEEIATTVLMYKNIRGYIRKVTYSGPWIENIPITSFYIEAGARTIKEANFVGHRVKRSMDYLRRMERDGIYHNVDLIVPKAEGDEPDNLKYSSIENEDETADESAYIQETPGREKVWVWECWVRIDIDGDGLLENLLVTIVDNTLLRVEENPFDHGEAPFEVLVPIIDTHKFYGISLTSLIVEFQRLKTALFRNIFDNIAFAVNAWYLVGRNTNIDMNALRSVGPGDAILTDDIANVRRMEPTGVPNYLVGLAQMLEEMKQQRSGLPRIAQGLTPTTLSASATAISAQMNAGQQRIELIARIMAETGCKRLFRKMISLNQQFIEKDFVIRVLDKEYQITPENLSGTFDLIVNVGVGSGARELQQQQLIQLLNIMPQLAQFGLITPAGVYAIVARLLQSMGYKNVDEFIVKPQPQPMLPTGAPQGMPQGTPQGAPPMPQFGGAVQPPDVRAILQNTPKSNPFT